VAKMASHIGLLVSFSLGAYLDWRRLAMIATGIEHFLSYANDAPVTTNNRLTDVHVERGQFMAFRGECTE